MSGDGNQWGRGHEVVALAKLFLVDAVKHGASAIRAETDAECLIKATKAESTGTANVIAVNMRTGAGVRMTLPIIGSNVVHDVSPWGLRSEPIGYRRVLACGDRKSQIGDFARVALLFAPAMQKLR